jgi:hypothetical protein
MAKLRLTNSMRHNLKELAKTLIQVPSGKSTLDSAYANLKPHIIALIHEKFPPKEMVILDKYKYASTAQNVRLQLTSGGINEFRFNDKDEHIPFVSHNHGWQTPILPANEEITKLFDAWIDARTKYKDAVAVIFADYEVLIRNANTLEDVIEIWPEAVQLRPKPAQLPSPISADIITRIKSDVAQRNNETSQ